MAQSGLPRVTIKVDGWGKGKERRKYHRDG